MLHLCKIDQTTVKLTVYWAGKVHQKFSNVYTVSTQALVGFRQELKELNKKQQINITMKSGLLVL